MKLSLSMAAMLATVSAKVGLMVPFYEYPIGDAAVADWNALIQAIDAHPALDFYVIINDENGAPYPVNPPGSIKDWAQWLGALNGKPNVKTIGYLFTSKSARDRANVTNGINQYASWTTNPGWSGGSTNYDIHIDGIFFDEIDTDPAKLDYNTQITEEAKKAFASKGGPIVLNPGVIVSQGSESLFDVADVIVDIETCYTKGSTATDPGSTDPRCKAGTFTPFTPAMLDSLPSDPARLAKSSVLVHDFYDSWEPYQPAPQSTLQDDVNAIVKKQVHSFYISQYGYRGNFTSGPASITAVADLAAQAQGLTRRGSEMRRGVRG